MRQCEFQNWVDMLKNIFMVKVLWMFQNLLEVKYLEKDDVCSTSERRSPAGSFLLEFLLHLRLSFKGTGTDRHGVHTLRLTVRQNVDFLAKSLGELALG